MYCAALIQSDRRKGLVQVTFQKKDSCTVKVLCLYYSPNPCINLWAGEFLKYPMNNGIFFHYSWEIINDYFIKRLMKSLND